MNNLQSIVASFFLAAFPVSYASAQSVEAVTDTSTLTEQSTDSLATSPARPDEHLSPQAREIVKLADSGAAASTLYSFVGNATEPFRLTADDVIYLRDIGIQNDVVTAMLQRDVQLQAAAQTSAAATAENTVATNTLAGTNAPAVAAPLTPQREYVAGEAPADVRPFYDALSPYGSWVYIDGNWAWQPNVVVTEPAWQPYSDAGRWVWSDCGWYWASDYSWGWAPFHYGRWWRSPSWGWVWYPGTTWAPSWVTWRTYGDYCGWAPLPPNSFFVGTGFRFGSAFVGLDFDFNLGFDCFTFVGFHDFFGHDFRHNRLRGDRAAHIFNRSTVVNNFIRGNNNNVVINNGVPVDRVRRATGQSIRTVPVVDSFGTTTRQATRSTQVTRGGRLAAVTRTPVETLSQPQLQNFVAQKVTPNTPVVPAVPTRLATTTPRLQTRTQQPTTTQTRTQTRRNIAQEPQNGPSVWTARRTVNPDERQLWGNNLGREQSLTVPSQRTSRGEVPSRPTTPEILEGAGASSAPTGRPQEVAPAPRQSPPVIRPRERTVTPERITPTQPSLRREAAPTETFVPRPELNIHESPGPAHMMPRSGDVFVPPSRSSVPPPSQPTFHAAPPAQPSYRALPSITRPQSSVGAAPSFGRGFGNPGASGLSRGESTGAGASRGLGAGRSEGGRGGRGNGRF